MANEDVLITPASEKIEFKQGDPQAVYCTLTGSGDDFVISGASTLYYKAADGLNYFNGGSGENRLYVFDYSSSAYATYSAQYAQLRDGSANIDWYLNAGSNSYVRNSFGVGTTSVDGLFNVSGGATVLDNGGGYALYFKNAGAQYGAIDTFGGSLSIEAASEAILSGASGVSLKGGNYGVLLPPIGTNAGDTLRLRFRELAAGGTSTVSIKAPDAIASDIQLVLPASAGTANQVLAIDSVNSGVMTLGFQTVSGGGGGTPGGSNTQLQYNNGGSFGGMDDWTWDGTDLSAAGSSKLKFGASLRYIAQSGDHLYIRNSETGGNIELNAKSNVKWSIDGALKMYLDGSDLVLNGDSTAFSIKDADGTETARLATASGDQGLLYLRGPTGGNAIYLDGNGSSYLNGGNVGIGTTSPDAGAELTILGKVYQDVGSSGAGNVNYGSGSFAHTSGLSNYGGSYSTGIGFETLKTLSGNAHRNTAVGYRAMYGDSTGIEGTDNTAVGASSMLNIKDGQYNVAMGVNAAAGITDGLSNTAIGVNALQSSTTANYNTVMGVNALKTNVDGDYNTAIGYQSMLNYEPGDGEGYNVAIGAESLLSGTTGQKNIAIGYYSLWRTTTGDNNVAVGNEAGRSMYSTASGGANNVFVGYRAAYYGTHASGAVAIGYRAGRDFGYNNAAEGNTAVGYQSGFNTTNAENVTLVGALAGAAHSHGNYSTAVGVNALYGISGQTSGYNTAIGAGAMRYASGSQYNVAIGDKALSGASTGLSGDSNVAIGRQAMVSATTARDNTVIGTQAGQYMTTALENVAIGYLAGRSITAGNYNTVIGWWAGYDLTSSHRNTFVGYASGKQYNQTGDGYNVALGMYSMQNVETGSSNVAIGYTALAGATGHDMDYNVAIGAQALYSNTTGDNNVGIGRNALFSNTEGEENTALGTQAGENITTGDDNVFVGFEAGSGITTGQDNAIVGSQAGSQMSAGDSNNAFFGERAGYNNAGGNYNTFIGRRAGYNVTSGDNNVFIGNGAGPSSTSTDSDKLYIHNDEGTPLIGGDFSAQEVTINHGTTKSITLDPYWVVSGDNQYSMISGSAGLAFYAGNSYLDFWTDSANSRKVRFRAQASDGSFDAGSYLDIWPTSVGATGDATANIKGNGPLNISTADTDNLAIHAGHSLQFTYDNELTVYNEADGNSRLMMRSATKAGMEFEADGDITFKDQASVLMTLTSGGSLGIGTAPNKKLHVQGAIAVSGAESAGDSGYGYSLYQYNQSGSQTLRMYSDSRGVAGGKRQFINVSGRLTMEATENMGIGPSTSGEYLHLYSAATAHMYLDAGDSFLFRDKDDSSAVRMRLYSHSGKLLLNDSSAATKIQLQPSGDSYITNNLGIGHTSPDTPLDIRGDGTLLTLSGTANAIMKLYSNTDDASINIYAGTDGSVETGYMKYYDNTSLKWTVGKDTGNDYIIYDETRGAPAIEAKDNSDLLLMQAGGKVGIGTTGTPGRSLEVKGNGAYMAFNSTATDNHQFTIGSDNSGFIVYDDTLSTYRFVIDQDSGNVGIGTTGPDRKFHVESSDSVLARFESTSDTAMISVRDNDTYTYIGSKDAYTFLGYSASLSTNNLVLSNTNAVVKVGIGTITPAYNLDVVGTTQLSGAATIDGAAEFKGEVNITGTTSSLNAIPRVQRDLLHAGPGTSTATLDTSGQQWLVKCLTTNTGVGNAPANFALTLPATGEVGSKYEIITVIGDFVGSVTGQTGNITIQGGNTGVAHTINGSSSAVTIDSRVSTTQKYRMATVIRIGATEWAMTVSDVGP